MSRDLDLGLGLGTGIGKWGMGNKVSGIELFLVKSIPRWKGDVIMIENDIEPKKGVTNTLKLIAHYYLLKTN